MSVCMATPYTAAKKLKQLQCVSTMGDKERAECCTAEHYSDVSRGSALTECGELELVVLNGTKQIQKEYAMWSLIAGV